MTKRDIDQLFQAIVSHGTPTEDERKVMTEFLVQPTQDHVIAIQSWSRDEAKSDDWRSLASAIANYASTFALSLLVIAIQVAPAMAQSVPFDPGPIQGGPPNTQGSGTR